MTRARPAHRANQRFTDSWGCVWEAAIDGLEGVVIEHLKRFAFREDFGDVQWTKG